MLSKNVNDVSDVGKFVQPNISNRALKPEFKRLMINILDFFQDMSEYFF